MPVELTQLEWLMLHLDPQEAFELRAACESLMGQGVEVLAKCPLCWLGEGIHESPKISRKLRDGFVWRDSPQGQEYWQAVYEKYKALESTTTQANDNKGEYGGK